MSTLAFFFLCIQACLVQNALSTLIGPAVYGNGFGLGNSVGAGLTAASAELAGWYGCGSPAQYGGYAPGLAEREIAAEYAYAEGWNSARPCAGALASPYAAQILEAPFAAPFAGPYAAPLAAGSYASPYAYEGPFAGAYGGEGIGDVAVAGEMPVAGTTLVAGQVPILGAVRFAGDLPAGGVVTIAGNCGCNNYAY